MSDQEKLNVTREEFEAAVAVVRAARKAVEESEIQGHSVDENDGEQNFTDINIC
jgi:hypothetical protein